MQRRLAWTAALVACVATAAPHAGCKSDPSGREPDTDGDGLSDAEELNIYGTSPLMPDTDGDGLNDYEEVVTLAFDPTNDPYRYNPLVSDVPLMTVVLVGPPVAVIQYTDETGTTTTQEISLAQTQSQSETTGPTVTNTQSNTNSNSQTNTNEVSRANTNEVSQTQTQNTGSGSSSSGGSSSGGSGSVDAGPDASSPADAGDAGDAASDGEGGPDASAADVQPTPVAEASSSSSSSGGSSSVTNTNSNTVTLTNSVATTVNPSTTFETSFSFTDQVTQQFAQTVTQDETYAQSHDVTLQGGFLKVAAVIKNNGHMTFRITNIVLSSTFVAPSGYVVAVQNLEIDEQNIATFQPFSLAPGDKTGPTIFFTVLLTLQTVQGLLENAHKLDITLATYELTDAAGKPFAFSVDNIAAKTALVALDYGAARDPEIYQVATNSDPAQAGVTAGKIFHDILHIPYAAQKDAGVTSVRDIAVSTSGGPEWTVSRVHDDGPDVTTTVYGGNGDPYDFDAIQLRAGDVLHVALAQPGSAPPATDAGPPTEPPQGRGPDTDGGLQVIAP
jgi:hypothetical protein